MKTSTLVILAAGMGSRYGGTKQTEAVTPAGETIVDFSIYDALVGGIEKVVFVVRSGILSEARERFDRAWGSRLELDYVCQDLAEAPERERPWGTAHAILSAREAVDDNFWVINADDLYGRSAFLQMASAPGDDFSMVGYRLGQTLSPHGPVSRGECIVGEDGFLMSVVERKGIVRDNGRIVCDDHEALLDHGTPVSMNFWGFSPKIFEILEEGFARFIEERGEEPGAEYFITEAVNRAIESEEASVRVLSSSDRWIGMTYREDRSAAALHIQGLRDRGLYPSRLW